MDGIGRRRLAEKRFGVFACARATEHSLTAGVPAHLRMPHSRWNDIAESELTNCGYTVLTRASDGGVDAFARRRKSLFVFFQGHPEYEANTLLLEYRRDIGRYLRCERETYPPMPEGYFDQDTADVFAAFGERCLSNRRPELLADFPAAEAEKSISKTWHAGAMRLYGNWLARLDSQRQRRAKQSNKARSLRRPLGPARTVFTARESGAESSAQATSLPHLEDSGGGLGCHAYQPVDIRLVNHQGRREE